MPIIGAKGSPSSGGFGQFARSGGAIYIEDVFSTWLYAGTGANQTITNGIDLSGKGGMVYLRNRTANTNNLMFDTIRGAGAGFVANSSSTVSDANSLSSFGATGFSVGSATSTNASGGSLLSWSFRQQNNFFETKTVEKSGVTNFTLSTLGTIGFIIARNNSNGTWGCWHRSATSVGLSLASTSITAFTQWISVSGTTVTFNNSAPGDGTYTVYGFAHNAGGFGLTGTDNVISCGSYTGTGTASGPTVTLGFEPQWLMIRTSAGFDSDWTFVDNMRGLPLGPASRPRKIACNTTGTEANMDANSVVLTPTGFELKASDGNVNGSATYIYMAIRRGPMRTPTTGTSVLGLNSRTGTGANATVTGGTGVTDLSIIKNVAVPSNDLVWTPRLTGTGYLSSNLLAAQTTAGTTILQTNPWDVMNGVKVGTTSSLTNNTSPNRFMNYLISRAPGFMDVVCYTGGLGDVNHNLGVTPELIIIKRRDGASSTGWAVWNFVTSDGFGTGAFTLYLNLTNGRIGGRSIVAVSSTTFSPTANIDVGDSGRTYVAYLFATCLGVSKVGTYTGNGSFIGVDCGFTAGARFVMIKRYDFGSFGDWYIWDSARGIGVGNDPSLSANNANAEVTSVDSIEVTSTGFIGIQNSTTNINVNGGLYLFLAIA